MFCKNCGRQLPDNASFCPGCGTKRSGGDHSYEDGRSSADIKNLPSYAKENDRSGHTIDSDRKKFSLSDSGQKKFSLSDSGRDKFSLSDAGKSKFNLSDKSPGDDGDGIVRISASREPAAPPKEPTGFVNPLKDSGGTVFRSDAEASGSAQDASAAAAQSAQPEQTQQAQSAPREPDAVLEGDEGPTGFVNPLKEVGRDIHWGSDGDRNQQAADPGEIDSHMGFAIFITVLGCCNCLNLVLGITAIVLASQVQKQIEEGNFEQARKTANTVNILCWIALGLMVLGFVMSTVTGAFSAFFQSISPHP